MDARGLLRRIEHFDVAMRAAIDERRVAVQRLAAPADLQQLRAACRNSTSSGSRTARSHRLPPARPSAAPRPCRPSRGGRRHPSSRPWPAPDRLAAIGIATGRDRRRRRDLLELLLRLRAQLLAKLREIAPHRELAAVLVDHLEVHEQVRGQRFQLEVGRFHARTSAISASTARPRRSARGPSARRSRPRTRAAAQCRRSFCGSDFSSNCTFPSASRHEPLAAARIDPVQRIQRHRERHAVARRAGPK